MEPIVYRNSPKKAFSYMGVGLLILLGFFISPLFKIIFLILGLMVFFTGLGGLLKRKPQIKMDEEGIYIGFKVKKKIPWKIVDATSVKKEKVDDRMVWMLSVRTKRTKNGVVGYNVHQANLDMLAIDREKLVNEIATFKS